MFDTSYLAGFFDGEGSIGIYNAVQYQRKVRFHLRTQLTQNVSPRSSELLEELVFRYGGNLNVMDRKAARQAYNWQLSGDSAAEFLMDIEPLLHLKRDQARVAIAWQSQRPLLVRNERGHVQYVAAPVVEFDTQVGILIKLLKSHTLKEVLQLYPGLLPVIRQLRKTLEKLDYKLLKIQ